MCALTIRAWLSFFVCFFFSSRRRHTRWTGDWSSDVCSSDLGDADAGGDDRPAAGGNVDRPAGAVVRAAELVVDLEVGGGAGDLAGPGADEAEAGAADLVQLAVVRVAVEVVADAADVEPAGVLAHRVAAEGVGEVEDGEYLVALRHRELRAAVPRAREDVDRVVVGAARDPGAGEDANERPLRVVARARHV